MRVTDERRDIWDERYRTVGSQQVSWFALEPTTSLAILDQLGVTAAAAVIDVGGGASHLADRLVDRGFTDVTVLDVSSLALAEARKRLGDRVEWERADLLDWVPQRRWDVWHDRAVFHFLTVPEERETYRRLIRESVEPGGFVVIGTFAQDGPTSCSGLPVNRYTSADLAAAFAPGMEPLLTQREDHRTPSGAIQPFTWTAFRLVS